MKMKWKRKPNLSVWLRSYWV